MPKKPVSPALIFFARWLSILELLVALFPTFVALLLLVPTLPYLFTTIWVIVSFFVNSFFIGICWTPFIISRALFNRQKYLGSLISSLIFIPGLLLILFFVISANSVCVDRCKGADVTTKGLLSSIQTQSAFFYDSYRNYSGLCLNATTTSMLSNMRSSLGAKSINTNVLSAGSIKTITCHENGTAFAIEAPLKTGDMFCVDSIGNRKSEKEPLHSGSIECP